MLLPIELRSVKLVSCGLAFLTFISTSPDGHPAKAQELTDNVAQVEVTEARAPRPAVMHLSRKTPVRPSNALARLPVNSQDCSTDEVALLLPLTGVDRKIGKEMLDAATLALFDLGDRRLKLRMFDTAGSAEGSIAAARAVAASNICLIIGPVFEHEVQVVRDNVRPEQSPLIAFSSNRWVASKDVILLNFLPEQQLRKILTVASDSGLSRVGFVTSDNRYGALLAEAVGPLAEELGLEVVFIDKIDLNFETVSQQVAEIAGAIVSPGGPNSPQHTQYAVDALIMPVEPQWAITIASLFEVHGVDFQELQLLGTGLWLDERLDLEPPLIGALFAGPPVYRFRHFAQRVKSTFGYEPPLLAALAYDAVLLANRVQGASRLGQDEKALLFRTSGLQGVLGTFWVNPDGTVVRELQVFHQTANGQVAVNTPTLMP